MRKINKGNEPLKWTEHKSTPGATYQRIPELADALLKEQGSICAYCMRRIPIIDSNKTTSIKIKILWHQLAATAPLGQNMIRNQSR